MSRKNTYGDQLTLFAAANLYNVDIQIINNIHTWRGGTTYFPFRL